MTEKILIKKIKEWKDILDDLFLNNYQQEWWVKLHSLREDMDKEAK